MSGKRSQWITRRGQAGVEAAIDQVIDHHPQPGEQVQHVPDALVEDSPYQARQPFDEASIGELVQAMGEVGFQGVLIVRLHGDTVQRHHGRYQLVYGHRRRAAWRRVCTERDEPCLLPVVVRAVSDEQMLELGSLYSEYSAFAIALADSVVHENLTVERLRALIHAQQEQGDQARVREERRNRRAGATSVQDVTSGAAGHEAGSARTSRSRAWGPTMLAPDRHEIATLTTLSPSAVTA